MKLFTEVKIKKILEKMGTEIHNLLNPIIDSNSQFIISNDFDESRFQLDPKDREEFYILLFSRLSNYFEKGLLLEKSQTTLKWMCSVQFSEGKLSITDPPLKWNYELPKRGYLNVMKTHPHRFKNLSDEWKNWIPTEDKWTVLDFEIESNIHILLMTQLAEPWLILQTEKVHRFIESNLTEYP